jgi:hypothetical protein
MVGGLAEWTGLNGVEFSHVDFKNEKFLGVFLNFKKTVWIFYYF